MTFIKATINSQPVIVDSASPSEAVDDMNSDSGDVLAAAAKWISDNRPVLDLIVSAGSGTVISAAERTAIGTNTTLATHSNRAALDLITSAGSGIIISAAERSNLHTHANLTMLDQVLSPGAGDVDKALIATGAGTFGWNPITAADSNNRGVYNDLAALQAAIPTGNTGDYAILTNTGGPATFAVWDPDAGPAAWIVVGGASPVISVNALTGTVVLDPDDLDDTATTNKFVTAAQITNFHTHANTAVLDALTNAGSGAVITAGERTTVTNAVTKAAGIVDNATIAIKDVNPLHQVLSDAASIAWDIDLGPSAEVTLAGNRVLALPTNGSAGESYQLRVTQDAVGGRTLSLAAFEAPEAGTLPVLSSAPLAVDILTFINWGSGRITVFGRLDVS